MKKSVLDDVHPEHNFWVVDGTTLKNMHELLSALEKMEDDTFRYHVNEGKNDFHNWVRDVHKDEKLAELLAGTVDKEAAASAIKRRIHEIQKPARELGKGPLQNNDKYRPGKKVDTTSMMRMFDASQTNKNPNRSKLRGIFNVCSESKITASSGVLDPSQTNKKNNEEKVGKNSSQNRLQDLYNSIKDAVHSWRTDRILASFQASAENEAANLLKTSKVPFPKPISSNVINHRKYEIIVTVVAVVFIISLIGVSSQAAQITGAAIGSPQVQEVQFLGLGGVFAVVVLLFAALHAIEKHAKNEI